MEDGQDITGIIDLYKNIPPVTRAFFTGTIITTLAVDFEFCTVLNIYFNPYRIINNFEIWRIITCFLFIGHEGSSRSIFSYLFYFMCAYRYSLMLERGSFSGRRDDFVLMWIFGMFCVLVGCYYCRILFAHEAFVSMLLYVWARKSPFTVVEIFGGLVQLRAPYLPMILGMLSYTFDADYKSDLIGLIVGHTYYFLEDVFPYTVGGFRILVPPKFLTDLVNPEIMESGEPEPRPVMMESESPQRTEIRENEQDESDPIRIISDQNPEQEVETAISTGQSRNTIDSSL